jgi:type I restriction enzyme S subunit
MNGLAPYPAYKDSGVSWLGEVPEHWAVGRLRNQAKIRVSNVESRATLPGRQTRIIRPA